MHTVISKNLIPITLFIVNMLIIGPIGWIIGGMFDTLETIDRRIDKVREDSNQDYMTARQYQDDMTSLQKRLDTLDDRIYELTKPER